MKLLFHTCCAPCLMYPYSVLTSEKIDFTIFFYNPNIHPVNEYRRRMNTLSDFALIENLDVVFDKPIENDLEAESLKAQQKWSQTEGAKRCEMCYRDRLTRTATYARDNGYDAFSSTLFGSIYQNHNLLIAIAKQIAIETGIAFYYRDFRDGFRKGQGIAREKGLYRQKYCGCIVSLDESAYKEKILSDLNSK